MDTVKLAKSFLEYCEKYPDQRFWQAIRNWSKVNFIVIKNNLDDDGLDTFYLRNNFFKKEE